jgi:carboxymethylenebutenolidase
MMATSHGVEADNVAAARQLLERCGLEHAALSGDQAIERAGKIAAAAADYERTRRPDLGAVFDEHVADEFQLQDVDATMSTMTDDPYLDHVPVMTGGVGREEVRRFYADHFIGKWPPDTEVAPLSRTVGENRVVDELIISYTHTNEMPALLPGIAATGRRVELPHVVVMGFEGDKVAYEHIYWDQASALVQVGVLDPSGLPVSGAEQARKLLDKSLPTNELISSARA